MGIGLQLIGLIVVLGLIFLGIKGLVNKFKNNEKKDTTADE